MARTIIKNMPTEEFSGIYSLKDTHGKRYIGSSKNILKRMKSHNSHMNIAINTGHSGFLNQEIENAVKNGETFDCEILAVFKCEMTPKELREIERIFLKKYGGCDKTYNEIPIRHKI